MTFNPEALQQTVQQMMQQISDLRAEVGTLRTNVGEALDLVYQRSNKNDERFAKRFKTYRSRLRNVEATLRRLVNYGNNSMTFEQQQQHHQHRGGSHEFLASPIGLVAASSPEADLDASSTLGTPATDSAQKLRRLVASKFGVDVGRNNNSSSPTATAGTPLNAADKRRRLAAARRRKAARKATAATTNDFEGDFEDEGQDGSLTTPLTPAQLAAPLFVACLGADLSFVKNIGGAVIVRVPMGSPLAASGVHLGDRIVEVDGRPLATQQDIEWLVGRAPKGHGGHDGGGGGGGGDDDDDIFGPISPQDRNTIRVSVVPAKKARSRECHTFDAMITQAVHLALPVSPRAAGGAGGASSSAAGQHDPPHDSSFRPMPNRSPRGPSSFG